MCNRHVKFGLKITNYLGKMSENGSDQRWKWVSGSWVMGQMGHHFWMGHVFYGSLPVTH